MGVAERFSAAFDGRRVLVTGHTGFKGGWLSLWLAQLGADVHGYALAPTTSPAFFDATDVQSRVNDQRGDIRASDQVRSFIEAVQPEVIFHLAAQPLVRRSYDEPVATWATNVMGTVNLLDAVHQAGRPCSIVVVSSDKCYENDGRTVGYGETDPLGGADPYSASKAGTELVVRSWRDSFFSSDRGIYLASARAGNVIGGGDWARDRIVPDCVRAFAAGESVHVRNPASTRPWQHVLDPLGGYLTLASHLLDAHAPTFSASWNFGPSPDDVRSVGDLVALLAHHWGQGATWRASSEQAGVAEATTLSLNSDKAQAELGWQPVWTIDEAARRTADWYRAHGDRSSMTEFSLAQIDAYQAAMEAVGG